MSGPVPSPIGPRRRATTVLALGLGLGLATNGCADDAPTTAQRQVVLWTEGSVAPSADQQPTPGETFPLRLVEARQVVDTPGLDVVIGRQVVEGTTVQPFTLATVAAIDDAGLLVAASPLDRPPVGLWDHGFTTPGVSVLPVGTASVRLFTGDGVSLVTPDVDPVTEIAFVVITSPDVVGLHALGDDGTVLGAARALTDVAG